MEGYKDIIIKEYKYHCLANQKWVAKVEFVESPLVFKVRKALYEKWPLRALEFASKMPYVGTKSLKKNV